MSTSGQASHPIEVDIQGARFVADPTASRAGIWSVMADGSWEPETVAVVSALAQPGARVIDIGAWVGPVTLLAAARGAAVRAYEPDPVARAELLANLAVNEFGERVEVVPAALGERAGELRLASGSLGDSKSSLVRSVATGEATTVEVRNIQHEAEAADFRGATLLKMDVEGLEFRLIPVLIPVLGIDPPDLLLSTHGYPAAERARSWFPNALSKLTLLERIWGAFSRVVLAPILLLLPQFRLARTLRVYRFRYVAERNGGAWRPLRRSDLVRQALAPAPSAEFWLSASERLPIVTTGPNR